jgi:hypothetical protein
MMKIENILNKTLLLFSIFIIGIIYIYLDKENYELYTNIKENEILITIGLATICILFNKIYIILIMLNSLFIKSIYSFVINKGDIINLLYDKVKLFRIESYLEKFNYLNELIKEKNIQLDKSIIELLINKCRNKSELSYELNNYLNTLPKKIEKVSEVVQPIVENNTYLYIFYIVGGLIVVGGSLYLGYKLYYNNSIILQPQLPQLQQAQLQQTPLNFDTIYTPIKEEFGLLICDKFLKFKNLSKNFNSDGICIKFTTEQLNYIKNYMCEDIINNHKYDLKLKQLLDNLDREEIKNELLKRIELIFKYLN